jgi:hypothetical protein
MAIHRKKTKQYSRQRAAKRCPMVASVEAVDISTQTRLSARTSELAIGGCYIDALNPFPVGTVIELRILRDQGTFEAQGKVVYCDSPMGMGVAFTEITPEQRSVLEDWLAEIVKPAS